MLICCPECELQVSDKAVVCPHCGYPIKPTKEPSSRSNRKKRLPNGFGQITELKGRNLRNRFRAMVTVGKDENGRPICKLLEPTAYFATYNEAYAALVESQKKPWLKHSNITFQEVYDEWSEEYFKQLTGHSSKEAHVISWKYLAPLHDCKLSDIRIKDLKKIIEEAWILRRGTKVHATPAMMQNIKATLNLLYDYAVENEYVDKNLARSFILPKSVWKEYEKVKTEHMTFTKEEKTALWEHKDEEYVNMLLIHLMTGFRPTELCELELVNVDLVNWTLKGGNKTEAGKNRIVPIHSSIREMVKNQYECAKSIGSKRLFFDLEDRDGLNIARYRIRYERILKRYSLDIHHRPHDPRKDFITEAKKAGVDEYALKRIVGHYIEDITEKVYTERDIEWLRNEIEKIKVE